MPEARAGERASRGFSSIADTALPEKEVLLLGFRSRGHTFSCPCPLIRKSNIVRMFGGAEFRRMIVFEMAAVRGLGAKRGAF